MGLQNGEISFAEAVGRVSQCKLWNHLKGEFLKEVGVASWDEAKQKFPKYASKDRLMQFSKSKPQPFKVATLSTRITGILPQFIIL